MARKTHLKNLYIIDGVRTPIGSPHKGLKNFTAVQLSAVTISEILRRNQIKEDLVEEVIIGNTVAAGAGQNLARQAAIGAGLSSSVPAFSVNNVCGSGLQALIFAARAIACGESDLIIAGGAESASFSPYFLDRKKKDNKGDDDLIEPSGSFSARRAHPEERSDEGSQEILPRSARQDEGSNIRKNSTTPHLIDSLIHDGLWCNITDKHMGNLIEDLAGEFHITREAQDKFTFDSHIKACWAKEKEKFSKEIVPVKTGGGEAFSEDERPRKNINMERLSNLPCSFKEDGTVTAGNASVPCDGAACVILASEKAVKKHGLVPKARILGYVSTAVEPQKAFTASIPSIEKCLKECSLSIDDIDLFEVCESFAAQAILVRDQLKIPNEKLNIFGGDVALGHPLGTAGIRVLVTLLHALIDQKKKKGIASVCLGGGGAVTLVIEIMT